MKPPCGKVCPERAPGCHGKCEKYQAFRQGIEAERSQRIADGDIGYYKRMTGYRVSHHCFGNSRRNWVKDDKNKE